MALSYHWCLTASLLLISGSLALLTAYVSVVYSVLSVIGVGVVILWMSWQLSKLLKATYDLCSCRVDPAGKAVLVTGCSSGFGYQLTVRLDALGFQVIGCCRNVEAPSVKKLIDQCSDKLRVIRMDVSSDSEVDQIKAQFDKMLAGSKLWAIVNNAGVLGLHGIEWAKGMKVYQDCFDINTLGVIRVTRAFLPFLRQTPGSRLVFNTSIEDRLEPLTQPSYAASKFATRAFANSCRRELRDMGVHVSIIAPAFFRTELTSAENMNRVLEENWRESDPEVKASYGQKHYELFYEFMDGSFALIHEDITPVVDAMADAVSKASQPKFHCRVAGFAESLMLWLVDILPDELVDVMNTNSLVISQLKVIKFLRGLFKRGSMQVTK